MQIQASAQLVQLVMFSPWSVYNIGRLASRVLCATLAIPLPAARNQTDQLLDIDDGGVEKRKRLAGLLSLNSLPTRQTLVKDLVSTAVCLH